MMHNSIVAIINKRKLPYNFNPQLLVSELSSLALIDSKPSPIQTNQGHG